MALTQKEKYAESRQERTMKNVLSVATVAVRPLLSYYALLITLSSVVQPDGVNKKPEKNEKM